MPCLGIPAGCFLLLVVLCFLFGFCSDFGNKQKLGGDGCFLDYVDDYARLYFLKNSKGIVKKNKKLGGGRFRWALAGCGWRKASCRGIPLMLVVKYVLCDIKLMLKRRVFTRLSC